MAPARPETPRTLLGKGRKADICPNSRTTLPPVDMRIASIRSAVSSTLLALLACSPFDPAQAAPAGEPLKVPVKGRTGFTLLPEAETGVSFTNRLDELEGARNRTLSNGSGVAIGDFDGDGLPDLYFCSLEGKNRLYRNLGGFKFEDVTARAGVECFGYVSRGAVFADVNGDGHADLLVGTSGNGVLVFLNDGHGGFKNFTSEAGTKTRYASVTMALADVDGDGDLDLYVCNNRLEDFRDTGKVDILQVDGKPKIPERLQDRFTFDASGNLQEYGEPDQLYLNDGKAHFTPVSWTDGSFLDEDGKRLDRPPLDWGLTATFRDINGDGAPDLYVCNDYWTPDRIWMNDGHGHFRAIDRLAIRNTSASSMGVDFADIDGDGHLDFFVVDMLSRDHQRRKMQMGAMKPTPIAIGLIDNRPQVMRNTLHLARGDGTFAEVAYMAGVAASEWSWQPLFIDVDLDGFEDIVVSSGHFRDVQDADTSNKIKELQKTNQLVPNSADSLSLAAPDRQSAFTAELLQMARLRPRLESPIVAFHNKGDATFDDATSDWGTSAKGVHHGIALADLDGDGDLDIVVNNLESPAGIYRNDSPAPRVAVQLHGLAGNPDGVGATVRLLGGAVPQQMREVVAGGRYLSGSQTRLCFAAGEVKNGMTLQVTWRSGKQMVLPGVEANRLYVLEEKSAAAVGPRSASGGEAKANGAASPALATGPLFEDASSQLEHVHHENSFDDFQRQLLLPNRLSQLGPGVAWADLNGDGIDDLLIGSGRDGSLAVFTGGADHRLHPLKSEALNQPAERDQTSLVAFSAKAGATSLLVGLSNFEDGEKSGESAARFDFTGNGAHSAKGLPQLSGATGPLVMGDVDGDGQLDVFVGGRSLPGRYPEAASSHLFLRRGDAFVLDETNAALFKSLGLVSGAVFTDLNGDGAPDLVLAMEWGPITIFLNDGKGHFSNATKKFGLADRPGWWNAVTAGDFDGDGRMDLIATNWGRNSKYEHHFDAHEPLRVYWGEFNGDGIVLVIESHFGHAMHQLVPERGLSCSSTAMPFIKRITPTYQAFGGSGIGDIYGDKLKDAPSLYANTLEHLVLLNRGDHFEAAPLPAEAQRAPAFGVTVADFDGDGKEDIFLSQNFFAAQIETPRIDAGRGLLLKGDGQGHFTPVPGQLSGLAIYGDGRGAAAGDFDRDGRMDLAVAQNGAATKLYRNIRATPGLRVHLAGPDGNVTGLGAQVAVVFASGRRGPVREIHGGSGYWSQDSSAVVLSAPEPAAKIQVRWPGGKETSSEIPVGAVELTISGDGAVRAGALTKR